MAPCCRWHPVALCEVALYSNEKKLRAQHLVHAVQLGQRPAALREQLLLCQRRRPRWPPGQGLSLSGAARLRRGAAIALSTRRPDAYMDTMSSMVLRSDSVHHSPHASNNMQSGITRSKYMLTWYGGRQQRRPRAGIRMPAERRPLSGTAPPAHPLGCRPERRPPRHHPLLPVHRHCRGGRPRAAAAPQTCRAAIPKESAELLRKVPGP